MRTLRLVSLLTLVVASACAPAQRTQESAPAATEGAASQTPKASGSTQPLGEFEPIGPAEMDLYLKVMRAAAGRLKNLSSADREALQAFRNAKLSPSMSAEQMAALDRATKLLSLDETVAKEMGVYKRYQSISGRIPDVSMGPMGGEGDPSDDPPMTPEQKRQRKERIERFRRRKQLDDAAVAQHRDEILSLQKQVHLMLHPESIPK